MNDKKLICIHQEKIENDDTYVVFTGNGIETIIVCNDCFNLDLKQIQTISIDSNVLSKILDSKKITWHGLKGNPSPIISNNYSFQEDIIEYSLDSIHTDNILAFSIKNSVLIPVIYLLTDKKQVFEITWHNNQIEQRLMVELTSWEKIDPKEKITIKFSDNLKFLAIYNTLGSFGYVYNIESEKIVLNLDRQDYHVEHSLFPVVLFHQDTNDYVIHGTDWNRLDLFNLTNEESLSERTFDDDEEEAGTADDDDEDDKNLDYFYGDTTVSPNLKWVISSGWIWSPIGVLHCFNLQDWMEKNKFEPENGESVIQTNPTDDWDQILVWIDDEKDLIGVEGYVPDSDVPIHAFVVMNITTDEILSWIVGPEGILDFYDNKLYSWNVRDKTISIWNFKTGERIFHKTEVDAKLFHKESQTWFIFENDKLKALKVTGPVEKI